VELLPYISNQIELSELDANVMLAGMTIDTGRFHNRTGARTYEAAAQLRQAVADPQLVDDWLKDSYEEFSIKARAISMSQRYANNIVLCPVKDMVLSRSMMSQVADSIMEIQNVDAAFVLANDNDNETAVSARSNGKVNVQVIMEKMHGGGHMTMAALQRDKCSIDDLQAELLKTIDTYFKEDQSDEGDSEDGRKESR